MKQKEVLVNLIEATSSEDMGKVCKAVSPGTYYTPYEHHNQLALVKTTLVREVEKSNDFVVKSMYNRLVLEGMLWGF